MIETPALAPGESLICTIRHGLTELNRDKRVGGRLDVALLEEGIRQAEEASGRFVGTPVDVVIASPLRRAIQTAQIVTGWPPEAIVIDELCTERAFGRMEGLTRSEVATRFPEVRYLQIDNIGYSLNPPGGEPFPVLQDRARRFLNSVLEPYRGKRILISSHQNFLQQLHGVLRSLDPFEALRWDILNLELNLFHVDGSDRLLAHRVVYLVPSAAQYPSF